jgi:rare lipoprotein A
VKPSRCIFLFTALYLSGCAGSLPRFTGAASPAGDETLLLEGEASFYGDEFAGRRTSNGEQYDPSALTAAHRTLAFNTRIRVTNQINGLSVIVRINDRGPWRAGRILDLSMEAAHRLKMTESGTVPVRIEILP